MTDLDAPPTVPVFPPLFSGVEATGAVDPFVKAQAQALQGCDAGLVVYNVQADRLRAAIVFAPETNLHKAMAILPLCAVGFQNALGALAPPEVAVHVTWNGALLVNGAICGGLSVAASGTQTDAEPDWVVVGLEVPLMNIGSDPGKTPDQTALYDEGCVDVNPIRLLEAWVRHTLVWINRWNDGDLRNLHEEWRGLVHGLGEEAEIMGQSGVFVGVDEDFGMLLRQDDTTQLVALTALLKED